MVLEKIPESALDSKEIKPVNLKRDQPCIFTDAEAPVFWSSDVNRQLIGKALDVGKGRGQEKKRMTENEMFGWHHLLDAHEFEQALGVGDGQGSLVFSSPWGRKESDTTE